MNEASKTRLLREREFTEKFLSGSVIDIGCGADLVVPHARPFDCIHGDAGRIGEFVRDEAFDCVHSSHCLEHMDDVPGALRQWWDMVRPGGVLVIVVPEENLYEQGIWPSLFNPDHKATFRLDTETSWSPVSYDLRKLLQSLPGAEMLDIRIQDRGYDYRLVRSGVGRFGRLFARVHRTRRAAMRRLRISTRRLDRLLTRVEFLLGAPIDQTLTDAVAQIQAVVRKLPPGQTEIDSFGGLSHLPNHGLKSELP